MLYVAGVTESANFDTAVGGRFNTTYGGADDAFVDKLDPTQSGAGSLVYSTYLGGTGTDTIRQLSRSTQAVGLTP